MAENQIGRSSDANVPALAPETSASPAQTEVYAGPSSEPRQLESNSNPSAKGKDAAQEIATFLDNNDPVSAEEKLRECVRAMTNVDEFKKLIFDINSKEQDSVGVDLTLVDENGEPVTEVKAFDFIIGAKQAQSGDNTQRPGDSQPPTQQDSNDDVEKAKTYLSDVQAKSPTLKALYEQWQNTPWTKLDSSNPDQGKIFLKNDSTDVVYDPAKGQLVIGAPTAEGLKAKNPNLSDEQIKNIVDTQAKQLPELVAHQMYAAMHQSLPELYSADAPVGKEKYVDLRLTDMAGAYLSEIEVNRELGNSEPVFFAYKDQSGVEHRQNLNERLVFSDPEKKVIDEAKTIANLKDFLVNFKEGNQPPLAINKELASNYDSYVSNFAANKQHLTQKGYLTKGS